MDNELFASRKLATVDLETSSGGRHHWHGHHGFVGGGFYSSMTTGYGYPVYAGGVCASTMQLGCRAAC
jgi:hypothetical protein